MSSIHLTAFQMESNKNLMESLKKVNVEVTTVYDLVNSQKHYPNAIPILIDFLEKEKGIDNKTLEGIVRALAVRDARGLASKTLFNLYAQLPKSESHLRWAIGNTIDVIYDEDDFGIVCDVVRDKSNGMSRQMFVVSLGKSKKKEAENILIELLDDDEVILQAIKGLLKIKSKKAIPFIKDLASDSRKAVQKASRQYLEKVKI